MNHWLYMSADRTISAFQRSGLVRLTSGIGTSAVNYILTDLECRQLELGRNGLS